MPTQKTEIRGELDPLHAERINQGTAKVGLFEHGSWGREVALDLVRRIAQVPEVTVENHVLPVM